MSLPVDKQNWTDLLAWMCSNLLHNVSLDKKNVKWWSHVIFFTISCHNASKDAWAYSIATYIRHQKDAMLVFAEWCHRKHRARRNNRYTSDLRQSEQNYLSQSCGDKGHFASKCSKPYVLYVINYYERGVSKYLHGLPGVKVLEKDYHL